MNINGNCQGPEIFSSKKECGNCDFFWIQLVQLVRKANAQQCLLRELACRI